MTIHKQTTLTQPLKIYVAGHRGMVGSALTRLLQQQPMVELILPTRHELELTDAAAVEQFFNQTRPDHVYLAAARVGGIHANNHYPVDFLHQNLMIQLNVLRAAWRSKVQRLLVLGSSCIYPRLAPQPMAEEALLTGPLEPTNEPYAIAKIAGIKLCESYNRQYGTDFRSVMPTNLYGPGDNFNLEDSHVIPALLRRFHEARQHQQPQIRIWGSGQAYREFLHVDDMAAACLHVMNLPLADYQKFTETRRSHLNIGTGQDIQISALANLIQDITQYSGQIVFDTHQPDGTPRKLLDVTRIHASGWHAHIGLRDGLTQTYDWFVHHLHEMRT
jgi:GDP-L-fucose synthase